MEIIAQTKYIRISPKKVHALARATLGLNPQLAIDRLTLLGNKASRVLTKVILSAFSNAKKNANLDPKLLKIKSIETGKGPFFKRWNPVSRGIAHQIKKRTSHIKVILEEEKEKNGT